MKAFVLAGGLGTRIRSQFGDLPKALIPVGGRPFVVHQLEWVRECGLRNVVMCLGHGADQIRDLLGDGRDHGVAIDYSIEPQPMGTGGALKLAASKVEGPALVLNGDTLAPCDPWALERARWEGGATGAVALYEEDDTGSRGRVEQNGSGRIVRFVEKDLTHRGAGWVNGGVYAFAPALWLALPEGESSLEREVLPRLAGQGRLQGACFSGTFFDIGTPDEWARAERNLSR